MASDISNDNMCTAGLHTYMMTFMNLKNFT